jgi:hypothetical protein
VVHEKSATQFGNQKQRATDTLGSLAGAVRGVTDQLREGGQTGIADYATRAADTLERWSSTLGEQDLDDAVRQVRQFARRRPAFFLGAAFGVGVLAARFLKSSAEDRYEAGASQRREPNWQSESYDRLRVGDSPSVAHELPRVDPDIVPGRGVL